MKTMVEVHLVAKCSVLVEIDHDPDEDPTDLTEDELNKVASQGDSFPEWNVERVTT